MDRRKFIGACTCCAFMGAGAVLLNNAYKDEKHTSDLKVERIGVHLAEHCNLNCKYCSHYSPIAQKEFYDLDKYEQDMKRLSFLLDKKLIGLQLLGGEPLLNPNINKHIQISRECFPKAKIHISTNSVLLDEMDEKFWETLKENDVWLAPTVYPIKLNWKSILDKAKKYNIAVYINYKTKEKLTMDNLEKHKVKVFHKMALKESGYEIDHRKCDKKFRCQHLHDGKMFPCYFISTVRHLNNKFGTNFKVSENDSIDIYKAKTQQEVAEFLIKTPEFPFCRYCSLKFMPMQWETTTKHDLSEWT